MKKVHYLFFAIASAVDAAILTFLHSQDKLVTHYNETSRSVDNFMGWYFIAIAFVSILIFSAQFYKANGKKWHWICYFS